MALNLNLLAKHPVITSLVSMVSALVVIAGAVLAVDSRYAHSETVTQNRAEIEVMIQRQEEQSRTNTQLLRKSVVEDRLFDLDIQRSIGGRGLTPVQEAQYRRYSRQLDEIQRALPSNAKELTN